MARTKQTNAVLAEQIGRVILRQRKSLGLTQAELAEAVGLQIETISRMENGKRLPTIEKLVEFAGVFGMPVAAFFEEIDAGRPQQEPLLQEVSTALEKLPRAGREFVLQVAQNYARYHVAPAGKKNRKQD